MSATSKMLRTASCLTALALSLSPLPAIASEPAEGEEPATAEGEAAPAEGAEAAAEEGDAAEGDDEADGAQESSSEEAADEEGDADEEADAAEAAEGDAAEEEAPEEAEGEEESEAADGEAEEEFVADSSDFESDAEPRWGEYPATGKGMTIAGAVLTALGGAGIATAYSVTRCEYGGSLDCRFGEQDTFFIPSAAAVTGLGLVMLGVGVGYTVHYKKWQERQGASASLVPAVNRRQAGVALVGRF